MPRNRSTIANFQQQDDMETFDGDKLDSGDASNFQMKEETLTKILQVAHDISVISSTNSSEEKSLLLIKLKRLLDGDVVQANCEPHKKSIGCHHSLKESINNQFMQDRERLLDLLQALGQLVENYSGKNNAQDALQLLGILKAISCTDMGSELITHHPQIMVWLFDKFCMQDLMINNNREGEMVDLILSILQRCTRKYQVQIYDSWLKRVVCTLKDLLLNEQDFQSSQSMILLEIFLNLCNANKGRLPLIDQRDLKNILVHTSEIKRDEVPEMRLMTSRLQLLLTPFGLVVNDVDLAPLGINRVIKIMQDTVDNTHSPALMARCIDFLCDILKFSPDSFKRHEPYWLILAEEFQNMSEGDKHVWFNSLATPLLDLITTIQSEDVQLVISETAATVFNKWATELCTTILVSIIRMNKDNMVTYTVKNKAFFVLSKCLVSEEIFHTLNDEIKQEILEAATKDITRALGGELNQLGTQEYIINSARFAIAVGKFDGRFNASLGSKLIDTSMLELISDSLCLVLASLLLAAHMASCFPRLWMGNVQNFLENEKVCKHLASMLRDDSFHVANEVYLCIIPLLTTKGKLCLQKFTRSVDTFGYEQKSVSELGNSSFSKSDVTLGSANTKQEIISEYEMKLKMLETEMGHFKKCLSSNQELLQFSVSKNMQLADERARLVGRNLEDLARCNDLKLELNKKELKLENLQKYVIDLKRITDDLRIDSDQKGQRVAQAEDDLRECRERFETLAQESAELKKNIVAQEQKITKYRQLAHDNKLEMTKQEEVVQRKDQALKTLREENQYLVEELTELRKFRENILNVTSKTRPK